MSFHRSLAAATLAAALLTAGCADDPIAEPTPVMAGPTTTAGETTSGPESTTTTPDATTTTALASPPVTKPLTTAPPSDLLTEVTAAYDAAYADLLAAEAIPDENYPALEAHMSAGQAAQWRTVIRNLTELGQRVLPASGVGWRRIEAVDSLTAQEVTLEVCRLDTEQTLDSAGIIVGAGSRPFRYVETFELNEGGWRWSGREWVDPSPDYSDCSLQ